MNAPKPLFPGSSLSADSAVSGRPASLTLELPLPLDSWSGLAITAQLPDLQCRVGATVSFADWNAVWRDTSSSWIITATRAVPAGQRLSFSFPFQSVGCSLPARGVQPTDTIFTLALSSLPSRAAEPIANLPTVNIGFLISSSLNSLYSAGSLSLSLALEVSQRLTTGDVVVLAMPGVNTAAGTAFNQALSAQRISLIRNGAAAAQARATFDVSQAALLLEISAQDDYSLRSSSSSSYGFTATIPLGSAPRAGLTTNVLLTSVRASAGSIATSTILASSVTIPGISSTSLVMSPSTVNTATSLTVQINGVSGLTLRESDVITISLPGFSAGNPRSGVLLTATMPGLTLARPVASWDAQASAVVIVLPTGAAWSVSQLTISIPDTAFSLRTPSTLSAANSPLWRIAIAGATPFAAASFDQSSAVDSPKPVFVTSAMFSAAYQSVAVTFAADTNTPGDTASGSSSGASPFAPSASNCLTVLSSGTVSQLGAGATCMWLSPSQFQANLASGWSLAQQALLLVRSDSVTPKTGTSNFDMSATSYTTRVLPPVAAAPVLAAVTGTTRSSACLTMVFDGSTSSGSWNRPFVSYRWRVIGSNGLSALSTGSSILDDRSTFRLPGNTLTAGTYDVILTVTNWAGVWASSSLRVDVLPIPLPSLTILVPATSNPPVPKAFSLFTSVELPTLCGNNTLGVDYTLKWNQTLGPAVSLPDGALAIRTLVFSPFSFRAGTLYQFCAGLFASTAPAGPAVVQDCVTITPAVGPLVAALAGGADRTVSPAVPDNLLVVDASPSQDTDLASSNDPDRRFTWSCSLASSGANCFSDATFRLPAAQSRDSQLSIPWSKFTQTGEIYRFTVNVTKDVRSAVAVCTINAVAAKVLAVSITADARTLIKYNPNQRLVLQGIFPANADSLLWTYAVGSAATATAQPIPSGWLGSPDNAANLVILPNSLRSGFQYRFILGAKDTKDQFGASGSSSVVVTANAPPFGGFCKSDPVNGTAFATSFFLSCSDWSDDSSDMPLEYRVSMNLPSGQRVTLRDFSDAGTFSAILPAGDPATNALGLRFEIRDRFGAVASAQFTVFSSLPKVNSTAESDKITNNMIEQAREAARSGDSNSFAASLVATVQTLTLSDNSTQKAAVRSEALELVSESLSKNSYRTSGTYGQALQLARIVVDDPEVVPARAALGALNVVVDIFTSGAFTKPADNATSAGSSSSGSGSGSGSGSSSGSSTSSGTGSSSRADLSSWLATTAALITDVGRASVLRGVNNETDTYRAKLGSTLHLVSRSGLAGAVNFERSVTNSPGLNLTSQRLPVSAILSTYNDVSQARFELPSSLTSVLSSSGVNDIDLSTVVSSNLYASNSSTLGSSSDLLTVTFFPASNNASQSALNVRNLPDPIYMTLVHAALPDNKTTVCRFWNDDWQAWSTDGCVRVDSRSTSTRTVCACTHLTSFNVMFIDLKITTNELEVQDFLALTPANIRHDPKGIIALSVLYGFFLIALVLAIWRDRQYEFALKSKRDKIIAKFRAEADLEHQHDEMEEKERVRAESTSFWSSLKTNLKRSHTWMSVLFHEPGDSMTSVERVVALCSMMLWTMAISAVFYGQKQSLAGSVITVICSALAGMSVSMILCFFFARSGELSLRDQVRYDFFKEKNGQLGCWRRFEFLQLPKWCEYIGYFLAVSIGAGGSVLVLAFALKFDRSGNSAATWIGSIFLSFALEIFVNGFVVVFAKTAAVFGILKPCQRCASSMCGACFNIIASIFFCFSCQSGGGAEVVRAVSDGIASLPGAINAAANANAAKAASVNETGPSEPPQFIRTRSSFNLPNPGQVEMAARAQSYRVEGQGEESGDPNNAHFRIAVDDPAAEPGAQPQPQPRAAAPPPAAEIADQFHFRITGPSTPQAPSSYDI